VNWGKYGLFPLTVVLFVLAASALAAGISLRVSIDSSLRTAERIRGTREEAFELLRAQLDEETGLRGFAATRDPVFLQPYHEGYAAFPQLLASLRPAMDELNVPGLLLDRAAALNREWLATVARPILQSGKSSNALQLRGKSLVDRFRSTIAALDGALYRQNVLAYRGIQSAIARIALLFVGVVAALLLATVTFTRRESRLEVEAAGLRAAYQTEKHIADTLQSAFSQRPLPRLPRLRLSAVYSPAEEENKIGGDWYDVFELPENRLLFAIGDVAGHGIGAAVAMNQARQALMLAALPNQDPAAILERMNAALLHVGSPIVTAIVGLADPRSSEFAYATAGHPPAAMVQPGRTPQFLEIGGLPLGALTSAQYKTHHFKSPKNATLVLYTDGLVEYSHNVIAGERHFLEALASVSDHNADGLALAIHDAVFSGRSAHDDVAILTVAFAQPHPSEIGISA
jgi:serine phosphatase RsbU (regulator of sigma subunit)/CHASE3 domain sensor protein